MPHRTTLAAVFLTLALAGPARAGTPDTWVGGVEFPDRYFFCFLKLDDGEEPRTGKIHKAGGGSIPVTLRSLPSSEEIRIRMESGGATYIFAGRPAQESFEGRFFPESDESTSFPFRFVAIRRTEPAELQRHAGTYRFADGGSIRIRVVEQGFLRAYDRSSGSFHNLYPETPTRFFHGPDILRPAPSKAVLTFFEGGLQHSVRGKARRRTETLEAITWKEEGRSATLGLPGGIELHLRKVPPGTFMMGPALTLAEAEKAFGLPPGTVKSYESTRRETRISKPFWLGRSEVTNSQFRTFADEEAHATTAEVRGSGLLWIDGSFKRVPGASWRNPGREAGPDDPAVLLSWHDAAAFASWLERRTERPFRLPTEAEWEYASRAGGGGLFGFGSDPSRLPEHGWFNGNAAGRPHPVESLKPNAWGFHDMHGNVWEWCSDWFAPLEASGDSTDPRGPDGGEEKVLRGGSWLNGAFDCRSGYRAHDDPDLAEPHFGFRIATDAGRSTGSDR